MRWSSPEGPVSPAEFIPAAEDSGFIHELGAWALEAACRAVVAAEGSLPDGYRVAVNLAAPEFLHQNMVERVLGVLERTGASGTSLRLEITEATIVHDLDFAVERMHELRGHGVEFSIDDFGTGFSSLTYLRRMPIDEVKIDQSYVRNLRSDPADLAIVQAVLTMCATLGIRVVAEGVESVEDVRELAEHGCEYFQGFHFARPQAIRSSLSELTLGRTEPAQPAR
jgi:EAL domain-containing protein (putative c-di-GMP-specific phosphodiesterase class I)